MTLSLSNPASANIRGPLRRERDDAKESSRDGSSCSRTKPRGGPGGPACYQVNPSPAISLVDFVVINMWDSPQKTTIDTNLTCLYFIIEYCDQKVGLHWTHHRSVPAGSQVRYAHSFMKKQ